MGKRRTFIKTCVITAAEGQMLLKHHPEDPWAVFIAEASAAAESRRPRLRSTKSVDDESGEKREYGFSTRLIPSDVAKCMGVPVNAFSRLFIKLADRMDTRDQLPAWYLDLVRVLFSEQEQGTAPMEPIREFLVDSPEKAVVLKLHDFLEGVFEAVDAEQALAFLDEHEDWKREMRDFEAFRDALIEISEPEQAGGKGINRGEATRLGQEVSAGAYRNPNS